MTQFLLLAVGSLLLLAAHMVRALRWSLLFPHRQEGRDQRGLLISLGVGYAINAIVPMRVGELVRGVVASRLRRTRLAEVLATIAAERVSDLLIIGAYLGASWAVAPGDSSRLNSAILFVAIGLSFAGMAIAIRHSPGLRRLVWRAAGLFNPRIRLAIADFTWSTAEILAGGTLLRWQYTVSTAAMWAIYGTAYACFASAVQVPMFEVLHALLLQPLASFVVLEQQTIPSLSLQLFVLAPVVFLLLLKPIAAPVQRAAEPLRKLRPAGPSAHYASSNRYSDSCGYEDFLDALFSNARAAVSGFGMRAVDDCVVHRFYQGGSEALTALVEVDRRMMIRKFAMGTAADRLREQADWLRRHSAIHLPLVEVVGCSGRPGGFSYDMPLVPQAKGLFDAIHSSPVEDSRKTVFDMLERVDGLHAATAGGTADPRQIDAYADHKVRRNANAILGFARSVLGTGEYSINGVEFTAAEWQPLLDTQWLLEQMTIRDTSVVHGDLTIENVVMSPQSRSGYYVIDPNPSNLFDSPLIDWAKMMQSLHLGYEGLNRSSPVQVEGSAITLPLSRSEVYGELHSSLEDQIHARYGSEGLREVYFHELVNYLRLTPYKIRQSAERGLAFFSCTSLLLRNYRERFA